MTQSPLCTSLRTPHDHGALCSRLLSFAASRIIGGKLVEFKQQVMSREYTVVMRERTAHNVYPIDTQTSLWLGVGLGSGRGSCRDWPNSLVLENVGPGVSTTTTRLNWYAAFSRITVYHALAMEFRCRSSSPVKRVTPSSSHAIQHHMGHPFPHFETLHVGDCI